MFNDQVNNVDCIKISRKLSPYQDNELGVNERMNVESHLSVCEVCRKELESLVKITEDISSLSNIEPSENFVAGVMGLVNGYMEKKRAWKLGFVYSIVFTFFFICGVFIDPFSHGRPPEPDIRLKLSSVLLSGQKFNSEVHENSIIMQLAGAANEKRDN